MNKENLNSKIVVGGKYMIQKQIGSGSFGNIYEGVTKITNLKVAIKIENTRKKRRSHLISEAIIYEEMQKTHGIPKLYWYGTEGDYNILVIELLGSTLEDLHKEFNNKFSLQTTLLISIEMLERVEYFHSKNYIHRDIKPSNFALGLGTSKNLIYIFDYGLSKLYKDANSKKHIKMRTNKKLAGTPRFASIFSHQGFEQSRRDDLESIAYCLINFIKGKLPWDKNSAKTKLEKYEFIKNKKMHVSVDQLCINLPKVFADFLRMSKGLEFEEAPDYYKMVSLFRNELNNQNIIPKFDWESSPKENPILKIAIKKPEKYTNLENQKDLNLNLNLNLNTDIKSTIEQSKISTKKHKSSRNQNLKKINGKISKVIGTKETKPKKIHVENLNDQEKNSSLTNKKVCRDGRDGKDDDLENMNNLPMNNEIELKNKENLFVEISDSSIPSERMNSEVHVIPDDSFIENFEHWKKYRCLQSGILNKLSKIKSQFEFCNILNNDSILSIDSQYGEEKLRKSLEDMDFDMKSIFYNE